MSYVEEVQRAKSPREAILVVAAGLDALAELLATQASSWDSWGTDDDWLPQPPDAVVINQSADATDIMFLPVSEEMQAQRRAFASGTLRLNEMLADVDPYENWVEAYVKGGALWLYHGNTPLCKSYDEFARRAMVQEIIDMGYPALAHEVGIDLLKVATEDTRAWGAAVQEGIKDGTIGGGAGPG